MSETSSCESGTSQVASARRERADAIARAGGIDGTCTDFESRSSTHLTLGNGSMDWQSMLSELLDGGYADWLDIDLWEHSDPFAGAEAGKQTLDDFLSRRT